ncbi:methyltransferase domain-containing protein [Roseomonas sp. CCTCC AB2023176]|uniref:methyltransferase domain-containing protein n=1 Tax=Roseomonas sp. CCTCC AB2023176 TaxID=3342640 RepID=UPI0035DB748F
MLRARSTAEEWMDDEAATEADFRGALSDLERINRVTLAYRPTLRWLDDLVRRTGASSLSVLDVGAGGGDMLRAVRRWADRRGVAVTLTGLDRSPWAEPAAREAGTEADWITDDLFALDPARRFDAVICSLFTHHLRDPDLVRFLRWLDARAERGWMISDLHRHPIPFGAVWAGVRLFRMHPMVISDSTISIARGFSRADWERLVAEAEVEATIRWAVPFRWTVSRIRA